MNENAPTPFEDAVESVEPEPLEAVENETVENETVEPTPGIETDDGSATLEFASTDELLMSDEPALVEEPVLVVTRAERARATRAGMAWWIAPAAVAALLVLAVAVDGLASWGRVHPGVEIDGVAVGGMRRADAVEAIVKGLGPRLRQPVEARFEKRTWKLDAAAAGVSLDASASVDEAFRVGRQGDFGTRVSERVTAWTGRSEPVAASLEVDRSRMTATLGRLADDIEFAPRDATVTVDGTSVRLVPARVGLAIRRADAERSLTAAFAARERRVRVPVDFVPVAVTDDAARAAEAAAKQMVDGEVVLRHEKRTWKVGAATVGGWVAFRTVDAPEGVKTLEAFLDPAEVSSTVVPLTKGIGREPKDAAFAISGARVNVVPGQPGLGVDVEGLAITLSSALATEGERVGDLRLRSIEPSLTTDEAKAMGIKERISTYSTSYNPGQPARVNNIHTLADSLDGKLLAPGATWSFNGAAGKRTADKGYQEAPGITNGKLIPQLGGGICQVGTTMFNTIFFSGLPVVERRNHSFYISHYPIGRDATISWGAPDLRFKNDTGKWLLIKASYTGSTVTISFYGTDPGYDVSYTTGPRTKLKPFRIDEIKDPSLPAGTRVIEESGVGGFTLVVTRTVKKDGKVVRTEKFTSVYKPKEQVVRVGTKTTTPTSTATP